MDGTKVQWYKKRAMGKIRGRWAQIEGDGNKQRALGISWGRWIHEVARDGYQKRAMGTSNERWKGVSSTLLK